MTCQGHTADRWSLGFKPGSLVPELELLPNVLLTLALQKDDRESAHVTSPPPAPPGETKRKEQVYKCTPTR